MYHTDQGNLYGAIKVEGPYRTIGEARDRCRAWAVLGYIAIPVKAGKVADLKAARPPGWGKVQAVRVLVPRDRDTINARRRELRQQRSNDRKGSHNEPYEDHIERLADGQPR